MTWTEYKARDFEKIIGSVQGLSENQLRAHFTLYQGYVKKLNEIQTKLETINKEGANFSFNEYSELKRRESVAYNGTLLHEMYFDNLGKNQELDQELKKEIEKYFGSMEQFYGELKACAATTPGWVIVTQEGMNQRLHAYTIFEHSQYVPVQQKIILALDCWEHAYMIDYGIKKADYVNTFIQNINWETVNQRYAKK